MVRRPWARAVIILLSAPLALFMNFVRSLTLTLLANAGVEIAGTWHDVTGFAVLGITAAVLAALAYVLERTCRASKPIIPAATSARPSTTQALALATTLGLAGLMVFVAVANTRPSVRQDSPAPDLLAILPASAPGWQVTTSNDLYQFRDTLHTDHLAQRIYRRAEPDGSVEEIILYLAFWHAGQAPVSLVASHTPDACWPGSGWTVHATANTQPQLLVDHRTLPNAEYRLFTFGDFPQHVWFWHLYDGRPIEFRDPYSAVALLKIAWQYGFRHDGDQLFVRVSSNRPWSEIQNESLLQEFFHHTKTLGL
jgi:exosortase/archaeosortase family protein